MKIKNVFSALLFLFLLLFAGAVAYTGSQAQEPTTILRRVNAPYLPGTTSPSMARRAIFWFGRVDRVQNYIDGRVAYNDHALYLTFHVVDHDLWFGSAPPANELTAWDAISLYLDLDGPTGDYPTGSSYRFVNALHNLEDDALYRSAAQGNSSGWTSRSLRFTTDTWWRGEGLNSDRADRGWVAIFEVPFATLGLDGPPPRGTTWGMAVTVHDRDDSEGATLLSIPWPEESDGLSPASWGELQFSPNASTPPLTPPTGATIIRHGLNGASVDDAHVGGHSDCGTLVDPDFFSGWGDLNYQGFEQVNIQNQGDIADWPCFSKFYVTFPLDALPAGSDVISATLTLHQFGNAFPDQAQNSYIQVLEVAEPWDEATITWNNAPAAVQNLDVTTVLPLDGGFAPWPGQPYEWNVTAAVARAHATGKPVRLVLYSADGAYHSGKYFSSSDTGEWNAAARPTLSVSWNDETVPVPNWQHALFLPSVQIGGRQP